MRKISERLQLTIENIKHQKNVKARILNLKYGIEIKTNK